MDGIDLLVLRRKAGLRQYELAGLLGMRANKLSVIENGREPMPEGLLAKAAAAVANHLGGEAA